MIFSHRPFLLNQTSIAPKVQSVIGNTMIISIYRLHWIICYFSISNVHHIIQIVTYHSFPLRFKAHIGIKMCNELCFYFLSFICYHVLEVRSTLQSTVRWVADFCISFRLNQHLNQCKSEYFKHTLVLTSSP